MYRIEATKDIGGKCENVPMLTMDSEKQAKEKFDELVAAYTEEINAEMMRHVSGRVEIYLHRIKHLFDSGEIIRHTTIKRPLNSPKADVFDREF